MEVRERRAPLFERAIVRSPENGAELGRVVRARSFVLMPEDEDASPITVDVSEAMAQKIIVEPTKTKKGVRWKNLASASEALAELLEDASRRPKPAPEPDDEVDVELALVHHNAKIEILARDPEYEFAPPTALRSAPERRLVRVSARAIAVGDDASAALDRIAERLDDEDDEDGDAAKKAAKHAPEPLPRRSRHRKSASPLGFVFGAIGIVLLLVMAVMIAKSLTPLVTDIGVVGLSLLMLGALFWALGRRPIFVSRDVASSETKPAPAGVVVPVILVASLALMGFMTGLLGDAVFVHDDPTKQVNASLLTGLSGLVLGVGFLVLLLFRQDLTRDVRLLERLLEAPPLPLASLEKVRWGSVEGVVRDPSPATAEGEAVALAHVISEAIQGGSDPSIFTEKILSVGTFFVDVPSRTHPERRREIEIEVHPKDALWTSVVRLRTPIADSKRIHAQVIPIGGSVLIAGHALHDDQKKKKRAHMRSAGEESLLLFASDRGTSARAEALSLLTIRRTALAIIAACALADVALLAYTEPQLPAFKIANDRSGD